MSNDDSDWANLSYDNYSEEETSPIVKKYVTFKEAEEGKCIVFYHNFLKLINFFNLTST